MSFASLREGSRPSSWRTLRRIFLLGPALCLTPTAIAGCRAHPEQESTPAIQDKNASPRLKAPEQKPRGNEKANHPAPDPEATPAAPKEKPPENARAGSKPAKSDPKGSRPGDAANKNPSTPQAKSQAPAKLDPRRAELIPHEIAGLHYMERIVTAPNMRVDPKALPILLMIHGLGDRPEDFIHISDTLHNPPRRELALRGFDPHNSSYGNGWSWFPVRVKHGRPDKLARGVKSAADRIAKALKALNKKEGQPQRRFAVTGFSQGGILSFAMAILHPELIEFAVPVGGWLPPANVPKTPLKGRQVPIFALHGKSDKIVPYLPTERVVARLNKFGYDAQIEGFAEVGHRIPPPMRKRLLRELSERLNSSPAK